MQWGPAATKPEMLVFETPKTGPVGARLKRLGFAHKIQCDELKPVRPGTGDHE